MGANCNESTSVIYERIFMQIGSVQTALGDLEMEIQQRAAQLGLGQPFDKDRSEACRDLRRAKNAICEVRERLQRVKDTQGLLNPPLHRPVDYRYATCPHCNTTTYVELRETAEKVANDNYFVTIMQPTNHCRRCHITFGSAHTFKMYARRVYEASCAGSVCPL